MKDIAKSDGWIGGSTAAVRGERPATCFVARLETRRAQADALPKRSAAQRLQGAARTASWVDSAIPPHKRTLHRLHGAACVVGGATSASSSAHRTGRFVRELILGGEKSGKSRAAEERALRWLATPGHQAVLFATAEAGDDEMAARIECHRRDRALRVPALRTVEASGDLAVAVAAQSADHTLLVIDCLTLWLTQRLMPFNGPPATDLGAQTGALVAAITDAAGPVVLISNEIALGVVPMQADTRCFVDTLGLLHQRIAAVCERVTLLVAGCELAVKGPP